MTEKNGIIGVVAKTGGIKLDGDDAWYNPIDSFKEHVMNSDLKGKEVTLTLNEKGKVTALVVKTKPQSNTNTTSKTNHTSNTTKVIIGAEPTYKYQKVKVERECIIEYSSLADLESKVKICQESINKLAIEQLNKLCEKIASTIGESV